MPRPTRVAPWGLTRPHTARAASRAPSKWGRFRPDYLHSLLPVEQHPILSAPTGVHNRVTEGQDFR